MRGRWLPRKEMLQTIKIAAIPSAQMIKDTDFLRFSLIKLGDAGTNKSGTAAEKNFHSVMR